MLKERDSNYKFFHGITSSHHRQGNNLNSIIVEGARVEGVSNVCTAIFSHFVAHFKAGNVDRPLVDDLHFHTILPMDGVNLIKDFSLEEGKVAVWDCDSFKNSGPG